jgi:hypothetical protein
MSIYNLLKTNNTNMFTIKPKTLDQDSPYRKFTCVPAFTSVKEAILPEYIFVNEISDMYGLTICFELNGKLFKQPCKEVSYMYYCVFKELLLKVPMVPARRKIIPPKGKDKSILCRMIAAKYGAKKLF